MIAGFEKNCRQIEYSFLFPVTATSCASHTVIAKRENDANILDSVGSEGALLRVLVTDSEVVFLNNFV